MGSVKHLQADCLILGGGLSGWMAAREVSQAGLDTLVLHDGMGASPWVHGFCVPLHPEDSVERYLADTLESGQGLSDPMLAQALCGDAPAILSLLEEMGLSFNRQDGRYQMLRPLGCSHPRVVSIGNETGPAVISALRGDSHARELSGVRALRLSTEGGRVAGALAYDTVSGEWLSIAARAVVLASGGFCRIYPASTNKRDGSGDGIAMAFCAGATLCDMEFIQFEPSAAVWPEALLGTSVITTMFFEGAVLRNGQGERFMLRHGEAGECVGKDIMARHIAAEILAGRGTPHGGVYFDATGVGRERLLTLYPSYVQRYQVVGIDLGTEWIELAPAPHTSLGGVRVDAQGHTSLPGLFACGEVTGGLHGANRLGGSAGLETLVFGRRAGRSAARWAVGTPLTPVETLPPALGETSISPMLETLRGEMEEALAESAGPLREGGVLIRARDTLCSGLRTVRGLRGVTDDESFHCLRLQNDQTAALLLVCAALEREDSLGCHARTDFPERPTCPYHILIHADAQGGVIAEKEPL